MSRLMKGFTLIELLVSVTLFTAVLGTLFSVLVAFERTGRIRDDNTSLSQSTHQAFNTIAQAIQTANATEAIEINQNGQPVCVYVHGFYGLAGNQPVVSVDGSLQVSPAINGIATVHREKIFDTTDGESYQWVKREFFVESATGLLVEKKFIAPTPPELCPSQKSRAETNWPAAPTRSVLLPESRDATGELTIHVEAFEWRISAPILRQYRMLSDNSLRLTQRRSPFVTFALKVAYGAGQQKIALPVTVRTTITPSSLYGDAYD